MQPLLAVISLSRLWEDYVDAGLYWKLVPVGVALVVGYLALQDRLARRKRD